MMKRKEFHFRISCLVVLWITSSNGFTTPLGLRPKLILYGHSKSSTQLLGGRETDGWKAGDVYGDLDRLEQAINLSNAEQNLQYAERIQLLQHFAQARRPLGTDVSRFVVAPLFLALCLRGLPPSFSYLMQSLVRLWNVQFWTMVVMAPMVLLTVKRVVKPPPEPMPEYLQRLAPEYLEFLTTVEYERPETSCRDSVLVLLEYWTSAVATMAILGVLQVCGQSWMGIGQLVTRIAAVASLYQNPKQVYELRRPEQPRPMTLFPTLLQPLVSSMIALLPLGVAFDLYQVIQGFSTEALVALYASMFIFGVGTWMRLQQEKSDGFAQLQQLSKAKRWLYGTMTLVIWKRPLVTWMTDKGLSLSIIQMWLRLRPYQALPTLQRALTTILLWVGTGALTLTIPILHIRSWWKIVRIVHTHDISLALQPQEFRDAMLEKSRWKWRHRLEWQEESKRIGQSFKEWKDNLGYWFFFEGRVEDKMLKAQKEKFAENPSSHEWRLSDRILKEVQEGERCIPRDEWKKNAMKRIAEKHQKDYDRKQFEDPLGVAVQQTLGIGLGFNFDHDIPLEKDKSPSLRRLQARAAKSAIRRVQELYDAKGAAEELAAISDPKERNAKALEIRKRSQEEIETLAKRLTQLVPPNNGQSTEFKDRTLMKRYQQTQPSNFVRVSSHEFRAIDPMEAVKSIEHDLQNFSENDSSHNNESDRIASDNALDDDVVLGDEGDYVSSDHSSEEEDSLSDDDNETDEFVKAYVQQQRANPSSNHNNDDDDDDNRIILA